MAATKDTGVEIIQSTPLENILVKYAENFVKGMIDKAIEKDIVSKKTVLLGLSILSQLYPGKLPRTRARFEANSRKKSKSKSHSRTS